MEKTQAQFVIHIRCDSKSTVQRLQGISEIRRIVAQKLRNNNETSAKYGILQYITRHLERPRSNAVFLLEQRPRKEKEQFIVLERGYTKAFTFRSDISLQKLIQKTTNQVQLWYQLK
jgi:hypothetical protein